MERELQKKAKLDEEKYEGECNQLELKLLKEKSERARAENKRFAEESLSVGQEKRNKDKVTDDIYRRKEEMAA